MIINLRKREVPNGLHGENRSRASMVMKAAIPLTHVKRFVYIYFFKRTFEVAYYYPVIVTLSFT